MSTRARVGLFLVLATTGCVPKLKVGDPSIVCASDRDCPAQLTCSELAGLCIGPGEVAVPDLGLILSAELQGIQVTWTEPAGAWDAIVIERASEGPFVRLERIAQKGLPGWLDTSTALDTLYSYRVRVEADGVVHDVHPNDEQTTWTLPAPVTNLTIALTAIGSEFTLDWLDANVSSESYQVLRKGGGDVGYTVIEAALVVDSSTTPKLIDSDLDVDTEYEYLVAAQNPAGLSAPMLISGLTRTGGPGDLEIATVSPVELALTWTDTSTQETGLELSRSSGGGAYAVVATLAPDTESYNDVGLEVATTYSYRLVNLHDTVPSAAAVAEDRTSIHPELTWTGDPSLDASCLLDAVGVATFDTAKGATLVNATGGADFVVGAPTVDVAGVRGALTHFGFEAFQIDWDVNDSLTGAGHAEQVVRLMGTRVVDRASYSVPPFTRVMQVNEGQQSWDSSVESGATFGAGICSGCLLPRGQIAAGNFSCVRMADQSLRCWGTNNYNQTGSNVLSGRVRYPAEVCARGATDCQASPLTDVTVVAAGMTHACAVLSGGGVLCWGSGNGGQLGSGTIDDQPRPEPVCTAGTTPDCAGAPLSGAVGVSISVGSGANHACVVMDSGGVQCWGGGSSSTARLGRGATVGDNTLAAPVLCPPGSYPTDPACNADDELITAVSISAGRTHSCAVLESGGLKCWGINWHTGSGTTHSGGYAVDVCDVAVNGGCANGNLGGVVAVASAGHGCALLDSGRMACWGPRSHGALGAPSIGAAQEPELVCTAGSTLDDCNGGADDFTGAVAIAAGSDTTCAVMGTGELMCWGYGNQGALGDGTVGIDRELPVFVCESGSGPTCPHLQGVAAVDTGYFRTCALLADGGVRCWGGGDLGDGDSSNSSPLPVPVCDSESRFGCDQELRAAARGCYELGIENLD